MRRIRRRSAESFSLSFLDCICCGFGAVILLLVLTKIGEPLALEAALTVAATSGWGVCSESSITGRRIWEKSWVPSSTPSFWRRASRKARANTEWPRPPRSETGSRLPEASTTRARFRAMRVR